MRRQACSRAPTSSPQRWRSSSSRRPRSASDAGAPTRIDELCSAANEFTGSLAANRLTIVFTSSRGGGGDIYRAERSTPTAAWEAPVLMTELNSPEDDSAPWMSPDGCTFFFGSTRPGEGDQDIWAAVRATPFDPWETPTNVAELNDAALDSDPWLAPDLRTIFYTRADGSWRNLFVAVR